ncbi:MAG: InlB B-repeat-containing protein [Acholeplasma sp.]|jgi:uncharacterized repeat protein (TIGR02543 family)|nr:InlB B-repeat-containing protein [Acholeplasma sp.]
MKKVLVLVFTVLLGLSLTACVENKPKPFDYNAFLLEAAGSLSLPNETDTHLTLPFSLDYQEKSIELTWYTNKPNVISTLGAVVRPVFEAGDTVVTLTVVLNLDGNQFSRNFNVKVLKLAEVIYYTVTFDTQGGTTVNPSQVEANQKVSTPTNPTRVGHTFVAWHVDNLNGAVFDFNTPITQDITLYAEWSKDVIEVNYLDILYLNDFHGSIEKGTDELGLAYIANYVNYYRDNNPDGVVLLAGGDMFQGSALSNYYLGRSTLEMMNAMGFDAMVLGNHEFDWGIDVVTSYFDGNAENGEATFPLLGANVYYESTQNIVQHIEPYTIIERGDIKIGVIGTMGYGLESSIAQSKITGYVFASPVDIIEYYAEYLRTEADVDYVFALAHDSGNINTQVSQFTGNKKVDIIFNAHSHSRYVQTIGSTTIIQSSSNGKYVGNIRIDLNTQSITANNVKTHSSLNTPDPMVKALIDGYKAETDVLFNTPIITAERYIPSSTLSDWLADLMRIVTDSDIAFHNYGGTRDSMASGESITLGKLYKIFPFDNTIKTVYLDGAVIQNFLNRSSDAYSTTVTNFVPGTLYKVATNDYIFDKTDNPFIYGSNPNFDGTLLRDMVLSELQLQKNVYSTFDTTNTILSGQVPNARNRFTALTLNT